MKGKILIEALQVGAFQKLLLVLQVGCSDETRKSIEALKLMNPYKAKLEDRFIFQEIILSLLFLFFSFTRVMYV